MQLGAKLKQIRLRKKLSLQQVATRCDLSKGFVSQVENGLAEPSIASLKRLAQVLGVELGELFESSRKSRSKNSARHNDDAHPSVKVVRKDRRKMLKWPGSDTVSWLLTPDLRRKMEVILATTQPGETNEYEPFRHDGEEFGYVLDGKFEVTVGDHAYVLEQGDSIYFPSNLPHRMRAVGNKAATTMWVITPPSF